MPTYALSQDSLSEEDAEGDEDLGLHWPTNQTHVWDPPSASFSGFAAPLSDSTWDTHGWGLGHTTNDLEPLGLASSSRQPSNVLLYPALDVPHTWMPYPAYAGGYAAEQFRTNADDTGMPGNGHWDGAC
jgi:hypothetical protein